MREVRSYIEKIKTIFQPQSVSPIIIDVNKEAGMEFEMKKSVSLIEFKKNKTKELWIDMKALALIVVIT